MLCRRPSILAVLRRSRDAMVLAALALCLHLMATTTHLAMQAADLGDARLDIATVGLALLCHESDAPAPVPDGQAQKNRPAPCAICQTAQANGSGLLPTAPDDGLPAAPPETTGILPAPAPVVARAFLRFGVNRGPPSSSHG